MTRATVTQLRAPRAATRLGPKEARTLAQRARAAGLVTSPAARALFEHLLRVCDPRQGFTRSLPQVDQLATNGREPTTGLTAQLGISAETLRRANRALDRSGLVRVESGIGRRWTRYTVDAAQIVALLGELPGSPWGTTPVNPGENPISETPQTVGSDPTNRGVRAHEMRGQTPQNPGPNARVRVYARESDPSKTNSPHPREPAAGPHDDSPPAFGQGPLFDLQKCVHNRTAAQGGCRDCGTTRREVTKRQAAEQRAEQDRARVAEQLRQRAEHAAARAAANPPDPDVIKAARAAAQAGKRAPK